MITIGLLFLLALPAQAVTVSYDEAVSGDLSHNGYTSFDLDAGVNTVSGESGFLPSGIDFDPFVIVIPDNAELISVLVTYTNTMLGGTNWTLIDGNANTDPIIHSQFFMTGSGVMSVFEAAIPLGTGTYLVNQPTISSGGTFAYTFEFDVMYTPADVSAVPLPAGVWLFLTALGALGLSRRRQTA